MLSQLAAARFSLAALVPAVGTAFAAVAGVRLGLLPYNVGYNVMVAATGLGLLALLAALVWLTLALKRNDGTAKRLGLGVLAGSLLLLYPPLSTYAHRLQSPPIHDFTTDTENPPRFVALLAQRGPRDNSPRYNGTAQIRFEGETRTVDYVLHDHYQAIMKPHAGFVLGAKNPVDVFYRRDLKVVQRIGWQIVATDEKNARIEAIARSFWFGRISDIVIEARHAGEHGARSDFRAQSRSDALDDGANAAHAKRFFKLLTGG